MWSNAKMQIYLGDPMLVGTETGSLSAALLFHSSKFPLSGTASGSTADSTCRSADQGGLPTNKQNPI
jgi:hypothetical protein